MLSNSIMAIVIQACTERCLRADFSDKPQVAIGSQMSKAYLKPISLLWMSSMLGAGVTFLTQVLIARWLGVKDFGGFSSALAVVTIVSPLAGFGIQAFWLKVFGEEGAAALRWVGSSLRFTLYSTLAVFVFLLGWSFLAHEGEGWDLLSLALSVHLFGIVLVELVSGRLQVEGRYGMLALWQLAPHLLRLCLFTGLFLFLSIDTQAIGYIYAIVSFLFFLVGSWFLYGMMNGNLRLAANVDPQALAADAKVNAFDVFKGAWPFGAAAAFYLIYFQIAIVLLKEIAGAEMAGIYNVAFLIMSAVYLFPSVVYQKFLVPKIFHWASHDKKRMHEVYLKGGRFMLAFGLLAMVGIWGVGPYMVLRVFGDQYQASVLVLQILALAAPMRFLSSTFSSVLTTQRLMRVKVGVMCAGAAVAISVGILVIPSWGVFGAAATSVLVEFFLLVSFYLVVRNLVFRNF